MGYWGLARMDARFTLVMKPDHLRTYEKMPRIMKAHFCPQLVPRIERLLQEVHRLNQGSDEEEWQRVAGLGIALLSLTTIIQARIGEVTEEFLEEMVRVGINDMYCPINVPGDVHPLLPWVTEQELDHISPADEVAEYRQALQQPAAVLHTTGSVCHSFRIKVWKISR
jgi:hypothetical protein